jgi:hypothetical protein
MTQELFHIWHKEFGQRIPVFGIGQTEFLVFSADGWAWVPMRDFSPLQAGIYDYKNRVQYVTKGRPGMVPEPKKLVLQTHNDVIDLSFDEKDGVSAATTPIDSDGGSISTDWDNWD